MAAPVSFSRWFARRPSRSPPLPKSLRFSELGLVELPRSTGKDQSLTADAVNRQFVAAGQGQCVVIQDRVRHRTTASGAALACRVPHDGASNNVPQPAEQDDDGRVVVLVLPGGPG